MYQKTKLLGMGSSGTVLSAFHLLTGSEVAIKSQARWYSQFTWRAPDASGMLPYEALAYNLLRGYPGIPSCIWSGIDQGSHVLILDKLGANLEQLRRLYRGRAFFEEGVYARIANGGIKFVYSRGVILRDVKPQIFAMSDGEKSRIVYLFDFGLAKLYVDPSTGAHIPFREGRVGAGTARFGSYNAHFGRGRQADLEALGNVLLYLLHGRLPWQGIYSPSVQAKLLRIGEMKAGSAFRDLLARSPAEFTTYFDHCRGLKFDEKPNYALLRQLFGQIIDREGGTGDARFDRVDENSPKGTLVPEEYTLDVRFTDGDLTTLQEMHPHILQCQRRA
ncbi:kinase-like protein [Suillus ampliporus]|nr:kinase-like protein [Suillus ampliporus]